MPFSAGVPVLVTDRPALNADCADCSERYRAADLPPEERTVFRIRKCAAVNELV